MMRENFKSIYKCMIKWYVNKAQAKSTLNYTKDFHFIPVPGLEISHSHFLRVHKSRDHETQRVSIGTKTQEWISRGLSFSPRSIQNVILCTALYLLDLQ